MKGLLLRFLHIKNYYKIPVRIVFILSAVLLRRRSTERIFGILIMMFMIMSITCFHWTSRQMGQLYTVNACLAKKRRIRNTRFTIPF